MTISSEQIPEEIVAYAERLAKQHDPFYTESEIEERIRRVKEDIARHQNDLIEYEADLKRLRERKAVMTEFLKAIGKEIPDNK